MVVFVFGLGF
jgi:serine/threonine protein kinase